MSAPKDGGPAFPYSALQPGGPVMYTDNRGMDLRDYFAAKAMHALLVADGTTAFNHRATEAYQMADAMLKAREVTR